jgi:hypothetical protein
VTFDLAETPRRALSDHKQRREAGEVELSARDKLLAEYMTLGTDHARAKRLGYPVNSPLSLDQASEILGIRKRNARQIFQSPKFRALYAELLASIRDGAKAKAVHRIVALVDRKGEGSAADGKLQLEASRTVLGEDAKGQTISVEVRNNIGLQIRPGYVIAPHKPTIEGQTRSGGGRSPDYEASMWVADEIHAEFTDGQRRLADERQAERDRVEAERREQIAKTPIFRVPGEQPRSSAVENFLTKYGS